MSLKLRECDRCGGDFKDAELRKQDSLLVCKECYDAKPKKVFRYPTWGSPLDNGMSTAAPANKPIVVTITSAGITAITPCRVMERGVPSRTLEMWVVGDGAVTLNKANPICSSRVGDILVLRGTSDSDTITLQDVPGVRLCKRKKFVLRKDAIISLVYGDVTLLTNDLKTAYLMDDSLLKNLTSDATWVELSRHYYS